MVVSRESSSFRFAVVGEQYQFFPLALLPHKGIEGRLRQANIGEVNIPQVEMIPEQLPRLGLHQDNQQIDVALNIDIGEDAFHLATPLDC
jgi:hypothetical protein